MKRGLGLVTEASITKFIIQLHLTKILPNRIEVFLQKCLEVIENPEVAEGALVDWVKKKTYFL